MFSRSYIRLFKAFLNIKHWISIVKIILVIQNPLSYFYRYITGKGKYPWVVILRTPVGLRNVVLIRFEDTFTLNEIFIWEIYKPRGKVFNSFIDIGGNVGFASLYFLTRNYNCKGILVEPLYQNISRAKSLLETFGSRIEYIHAAVSDKNGTLEIGVEETGRYSGVECNSEIRYNSPAIGINDLINYAYLNLGSVDFLKIDCEGAEKYFMPKIQSENLDKISRFVIESNQFDDNNLIINGFSMKIIFRDSFSGGVFDYYKKNV